MELEGKYGVLGDDIIADRAKQVEITKNTEEESFKRGQMLLTCIVNFRNSAAIVDPSRGSFSTKDSLRLRDTTIGDQKMKVSLNLAGECSITVSGRDDWPTGLVPKKLVVTLEMTDADTGIKSEHELGLYERPTLTGSTANGFTDKDRQSLADDSDGYKLIVDALQEAAELAQVPTGV